MSKKKKNSKSMYVLCIVLAWLLFILLTLVFVFYFKDDLKLGKETTELTEVTRSEKQLEYEINSDIKINSLMSEYYSALAVCDQAKLKTLVLDPSQFDDMDPYQRRANAITNYANINCYTVPGLTDDAVIVYVTCFLDIKDVNSKPLDISQLYIKKTENGYMIDNTKKDDQLAAYIAEKTNTPDIQELYGDVKANIDQCVQNDPTFAEFYNTINQNN